MTTPKPTGSGYARPPMSERQAARISAILFSKAS
jgi:hypothetical protein